MQYWLVLVISGCCMPIAMLFERLVASKGASSCAAVSRLLMEQQNGANRSICCSNRRNWELVRSLHRPAALCLPSYRPCRQPNSTRVDLERGLLSLSADGISCDSFSPRAGRRRRAGGAAGSTSAACRHRGAGRGLRSLRFCSSVFCFFLGLLLTWPP